MKKILSFLDKHLASVVVISILLVIGALAAFATQNEDGTRTFDGKAPTYSEAQEQAYCEAKQANDDALAAMSGVDVPQDASSGCEPTDIAQMGSSVYYKVDVSTPAAFVNAVNGRGFNEGYGYQCVAGFKEFMYALSGKYVATKTGGASGYAQQQAQIEPLGFKWYNGTAGLQDGDWAIFRGGQYGHVAMWYQGKWFGQNQGAADPNRGNPFNLLGFGKENVIGYYRPNIYQKTTPTQPTKPTTPTTPTQPGGSTSPSAYRVQRGDTLGGIALKNGWWGSTNGLYGDSGYAQQLAEKNGIEWRGLIYPNQVINK